LFSAHVERSLERLRERNPSADVAAARQRLEEQSRVPLLPAYGAIAAVADGGVWVKDYVPPADEGATDRWMAYDVDGRLRGPIDVPAGFRPLYIDDEVVIGVIRDEFDVEYVRVYDLLNG
jgi:hypothetical protein